MKYRATKASAITGAALGATGGLTAGFIMGSITSFGCSNGDDKFLIGLFSTTLAATGGVIGALVGSGVGLFADKVSRNNYEHLPRFSGFRPR